MFKSCRCKGCMILDEVCASFYDFLGEVGDLAGWMSQHFGSCSTGGPAFAEIQRFGGGPYEVPMISPGSMESQFVPIKDLIYTACPWPEAVDDKKASCYRVASLAIQTGLIQTTMYLRSPSRASPTKGSGVATLQILCSTAPWFTEKVEYCMLCFIVR